MNKPIPFVLDGQALEALPQETILQAARRKGIAIPHLCYQDGLRADGNCRACVVEIDGERTLAASCCRQPSAGMQVHSSNDRSRQAQRMVLELLQSDIGDDDLHPASELAQWNRELAVTKGRFQARQQPPADLSHPAIAVRLDACIQCTRCLRACREVQGNDVIGYAHRGSAAKIVFDFDDAMGDSRCVGCGECVQVCPTGALMPAKEAGLRPIQRRVDTVCPYCGVGCLLRHHIDDKQRIAFVSGRQEGPANQGRLCVKGRYGFDYIHHSRRLTQPLMRRPDAPKQAVLDADFRQLERWFEPVSWQQALDAAAAGFSRIKQQHQGDALAGFGSAKGSNEEAYLFQKLIRTGFGSHNVDHCTRLCHASSVTALLEMIGSGAVSNPVRDVADADLMMLVGSDTTANHPVAATFIKNAAARGSTLIVLDPRRTEIARLARHHLAFKPDTDVALLNGIMHTIISEDLIDHDFIAQRTEGFAALKQHLQRYSADTVAPLCGIDADTIRHIARLYGKAKNAMILWGMGVSQHVHGTDNARALISLALICGQIGRPGCGLHPLRGQNNVQGASDAGLIPMVLPDYQRVDDPLVRQRFEQYWQHKLPAKSGLTVVEITHAITKKAIQGLYVMGENPAMSDPNLHHARSALATLKHLVVQDILPTETAWYADIILPASAAAEKDGSFTNTDRRLQRVRASLSPPGEARQDLHIIQQIAQRMGLDWNYPDVGAVFEEMRHCMPSIAGISWQRLNAEESISSPCTTADDPGQPVLFGDSFPLPGGRARICPAPFSRADELPNSDFPWILITGRLLEHWHTGAMTRHASMLDALEPEPVASLHPQDLKRLGIRAGEPFQLRSRRGQVVAFARSDEGLMPGQVFLPFCYQEAAANLLTNEALDPLAKIPEFKFCAVSLNAIATAAEETS